MAAVWNLLTEFARTPWLTAYWLVFLFAPLDQAVPGVAGQGYLEVLWQVLTGALALSLALQIFALERFSSLREAAHPQAFLDFAKETGLLGVFSTGIAAILAIGLTLLHAGNTRPDGWAGTYSVVLSMGTLALLAMLFPAVLGAAEPGERRRRRLKRIKADVQRAIDQQVLERIALVLLEQRVPAGTKIELMFAGPLKAGETRLLAQRRGTIIDIDLGLLRSLARSVEHEPIRIHQRVGQGVGDSTRLATLPSALSSHERSLARELFAIGRATDDPLDVQRTRLKVEAAALSGSLDIEAHKEIREAFEELAIAVPMGWQRYQQRYAGNIASAIDPLGLSIDQELRSDLWHYLTDTAKRSSQDLAFDTTYLPVAIAFRAVPLKADALVQGMCELLVSVYSALHESDRREVREVGARALRYLVEFVDYGLAAIVQDTDDFTVAERHTAADLLLRVSLALADALKACVEGRDAESAGELASKWNELLADWRLKVDETGAVQDADEPPAAELAALIAVTRQAEERRVLGCVGAAMWAVRRMRQDAHPETYVPLLQVVASEFGSAETVFRVLERASALSMGDPIQERWSHWIINDLGPGVHSFATDLEVLQAGLVLAIWRIDPKKAPALQAAAWLAKRKDTLQNAITGLAGDAAVRALVPAAEIPDRIARLREAVTKVVETQEQLNVQVIAAEPLDAPRLAAVRARIAEGWNGGRIVPGLFRRAGAPVETVPAHANAHAIRSRVEIERSMLQAQNAVGGEPIGETVGARLALQEFGALAATLRDLIAPSVLQGSVFDGLTGVVGQMRAAELAPTVIIAPVDSRLERILGLRDVARAAPALPDWYGFPQGASHWYRGRFSDVLVFALPGFPKDEVLIADLKSIGPWRDVTVAAVGSPTFELEEPQPAANATTPPVVYLTVTHNYAFDVQNVEAGRRLTFTLPGEPD